MIRFLWLTITPLGGPVVPEEKGRMAGWVDALRVGEEVAGQEERKE